jgi:hypothetical protein
MIRRLLAGWLAAAALTGSMSAQIVWPPFDTFPDSITQCELEYEQQGNGTNSFGGLASGVQHSITVR